MEKLLDKFLRYVSVDTMSDPNSETQPSSAKQFDLLRMLRDELEAMGIKAELDEFGYVVATIPSNVDKEVPAIGFIAHVDTSPDASGKDVWTWQSHETEVCAVSAATDRLYLWLDACHLDSLDSFFNDEIMWLNFLTHIIILVFHV